MTVKPEININSMAVAVLPYYTPAHIGVATEGHGLTTESVIEMWSSKPRISIMNGAETGITTAEVMGVRQRYGKTMGRLT